MNRHSDMIPSKAFISCVRYRVGINYFRYRVGVNYFRGVFGRPIWFFATGLSTWNEPIRFSSTLIIAPALSNSPQ